MRKLIPLCLIPVVSSVAFASADHCIKDVGARMKKRFANSSVKQNFIRLEQLTHEQAKHLMTAPVSQSGYYLMQKGNKAKALKLYDNDAVAFYDFEYSEKNGFFSPTYTYLYLIAVNYQTCEPIIEVQFLQDGGT